MQLLLQGTEFPFCKMEVFLLMAQPQIDKGKERERETKPEKADQGPRLGHRWGDGLLKWLTQRGGAQDQEGMTTATGTCLSSSPCPLWACL